jgi:NAD(P)-dependent dehydrogenase (short-subunit alcohol dehydrogenase family)
MGELRGIRVLVTGATSGLGKAMAAALAQAGARVMVTGRDRARAEATAAEVGRSATAGQLDVRDERSVAACVARAVEAWGGIDMLVNNAGIGMRTVNPRFLSEPQPFWEVTPAGFRDVVETKVVGCFLMAREVVPLMLREGGGRIVNISMNEQTMVRRGFVPYGPAGAGVEALSRVMAADLARQPGDRQHAPSRRAGHPDRDGPRRCSRRGPRPTAGPSRDGPADRVAGLGPGGGRA